MNASHLLLIAVAAASVAIGCDNDHGHADTHGTSTDAHGHSHGPNGEHVADDAKKAGHDGPVIALGSSTAGAFQVTTTRDEGAIEAGKDAAIDVIVTPAAGATAKASAVRFWIGTEDAKGSVKAKAEVEDPAAPNRWHNHAEIPDPIPADAKLWVEIEADGGAKSVTSFDLKR